MGKIIDGPEGYARNSYGEMFQLYEDATGRDTFKWHAIRNTSGKVILHEPHCPIEPEQAVRDLLTIARSATVFLEEIVKKAPDLCRRIAVAESNWPVVADLTEKDWRREIERTIGTLDLGHEIKGFLISARTAEENVIRCWATAIYETLLQSRFDFKYAITHGNEYPLTTEGCPAWVEKTLNLPPFTKVDSRKWARLGEEMLLEQRPAFLESPDLAAKKRSWTHRAQKDSRLGRASLRAIHREAFEDFAKELKNLAPTKRVWDGDW